MRPAEKWHEEEMKSVAEGAQTLVVGLGATGLSVARFLASEGKDVLVIDSRSRPPRLADLRNSYPEIPVIVESLDVEWLKGVSQVVLSPGLSLDIPIAVEAERVGIPIISDIELFSQNVGAPVIAVTGSNGKSTVVSLLERILSATGRQIAAGGNLGPPALDLLNSEIQIYLLEISSFQMETTKSLNPIAAAVLNLSPDHLDRHKNLDRYVYLKSKLARLAETLIFNWDDKLVREMANTHPRAIPFSVCEELDIGYSSLESEGERWLCKDRIPVLRVAELSVPGKHNEANALAALALASIVEESKLQPQLRALREFSGLPHRCQRVAQTEGILFVNDSKGTNVGATVAALQGISGPLVLIAGGQAKGADFSPLVEASQDKLVGIVVIGEAASELKEVFSGKIPILVASQMPEAVTCAIRLAEAAKKPSVTVLMSPACASFDMFADYQERGEAFIDAVAEQLQ